MKSTTQLIVNTSRSHLVQGQRHTVESICIPRGDEVIEQDSQVRGIRELGLSAKPPEQRIHILREFDRRPGHKSVIQLVALR